MCAEVEMETEMERGSAWPLRRMMNRSRKFVREILRKRRQNDA